MTESTVEYLVGQHKRLSAEHERFNSEGRPAFAREIRIRLEAIELAIVGVSKAVAAPDPTHHDALQWTEGTATTKFGKYTILSVLPGYQLFTPDCAGKHRWVATVTEAKYAAQADYDRRLAKGEAIETALVAAAEELDRISCVPRVTETSNVSEQFDLAKAFADRGAVAAWSVLRSLPSAVPVAP